MLGFSEVAVNASRKASSNQSALLSGRTDSFNNHTYSSFRCIAGSQDIPPSWILQHTQAGFPTANDYSSRICLMHNVCWVNDHFEYFENNEPGFDVQYVKISSFGSNFVNGGYFKVPWKFLIKTTPVPFDISYEKDDVFLFVDPSFSDNFGHHLIDDLFPALAAMNIFNIKFSRGSIIYNDCRMSFYANWTSAVNNKPRWILCEKNWRIYPKLVFGREAVNLQNEWLGKTVCMSRLIVGQSSALSLRALDFQRAVTVRQGRNAILRNLGIVGNATRSENMTILVLLRGPGLNGGALWPTLCKDVKAICQKLNSTMTVICSTPASQSVADQASDAQDADIIVAEHGTVSYSCLYAKDGTVVISIGQKKEIKEPQILMYLTHVTVFFMVVEHKGDLEGLIHHAIVESKSPK